MPRLGNRRMHLLHLVREFHSEPLQDVPLPRVVLGVHSRLDLLVIDYANSKATLCVRVVKGLSCALDLDQQLLPVCERITQARKDVLGFEIPKRLELEPLRNVFFHLLNFCFYEIEGSYKNRFVQSGQLQCSFSIGLTEMG